MNSIVDEKGEIRVASIS